MITISGDREDLAALLLRLRSGTIHNPRLMGAVEAVPRRMFVPAGTTNAYTDRPLPLACGQTMFGADASIRLVDSLKVVESSRVLEVGTGSGYVAALMARLGAKVLSLERFRQLTTSAQERLRNCGLGGVGLRQFDGSDGMPADGPFDRIVVHAAFDAPPRAFFSQLAPHGYLVCAIGPAADRQRLIRFHKIGSRIETEELGPVRYQPLIAGIASVL